MEDDTVFHTMFGEINLNNVQGELRKYVIRNVDAEFTIGKQIGKGGFGAVYDSKRKSDQLRVAIKKLHAHRLDPQDYLSHCREIKVLSMTTNHPCLVSLVGFTTRYPYTIITPFVENGSLFDRLGHRKEGTPRLTTTNKTIIGAGIAYGMIALHEMAIIHRDLKSMNILLDKKLHPKICDFGISKATRSETVSHMTMGLGTPHWMAPEMMGVTDDTYTHKVDIYAYGILLWEILTEDIPFKDAKNAVQVQQRVLDGKRPVMPVDGPASVKRLIARCWDADPNVRPEFEEIYQMFASGEVRFGEGDDESVNAYLRDLESHKFCTTRRTFNVKSLMRTRQTPESLDNLSNMVSVSNVMEFFRQCKVELAATNDASISRNIYEMITAVLNNGSAFVTAMIESRVTETFKWDIEGSLEYLHRVVATALHFIPNSFPNETVLKMMNNMGMNGVQPFTILHALCVLFQKHKGDLLAITPLVARFLECAKDMVGTHSVIAVVQLLCFVWKYGRDLCCQNMQGFNGALYYALKTNNPRACHDIYMFYAANANIQWYMNDNLLLTHLQIEGTQFAALSYMVRLYIPASSSFIPILFDLANKYETAGAILCHIANSEHAEALFGTKEAISGITKLGVESGIRMVLLLMRIPTCRRLIFTSVDVLRYLKAQLENRHDLFVPVKELIKLICTSKENEVFIGLKESGLLSTFDTLCFSENADDDMKKSLGAHAHCDSRVCPDNYKFLIDQYKANMWRSSEVFTKYVLAALSPLASYPEAQEYILQRGILQVILQGDITEVLKPYVVYIFRKCNVPLNL